jgi:hypothetical protein
MFAMLSIYLCAVLNVSGAIDIRVVADEFHI